MLRLTEPNPKRAHNYCKSHSLLMMTVKQLLRPGSFDRPSDGCLWWGPTKNVTQLFERTWFLGCPSGCRGWNENHEPGHFPVRNFWVYSDSDINRKTWCSPTFCSFALALHSSVHLLPLGSPSVRGYRSGSDLTHMPLLHLNTAISLSLMRSAVNNVVHEANSPFSGAEWF